MFTFESGCLPGWEVTLKEQNCTLKKKKLQKHIFITIKHILTEYA